MEKKSLNKKYNYSLIVGGLTIVVTLLAVFLIIKPLYAKSAAMTVEAKAKQAKLDELVAKKAKLEELKDKETELKESAAKVSAALPEGVDAGRLFIQFDELAKASSGSVKSVSESGASATTNVTDGINKVSYSLPVSLPNYFNFKDLLSKSETALRLMDIERISINSNNGALEVGLSVNTYTR